MIALVILVAVALVCAARSLATDGFRSVLWAALCLCAVFTGLAWSNSAETASAARTDENTGRSGDVVIVGDSVLWYGADAVAAAYPTWFLDTVPGREPSETPGSWEAVAAAVPHVAAGGWLVFQDYAVDTTAGEWRTMLDALVDLLPDDRCLAFVTSYLAAGTTVPARIVVDTAEHSQIMRDRIDRQPCHAVIDWEHAATTTPALVAGDGIHPTDAGTWWLYLAIGRTVDAA